MPPETLLMPLWLTLLLIALPSLSLSFVVLAWWRVTLLTTENQRASEALLHDITARTQVIVAQNREILRRMDEG